MHAFNFQAAILFGFFFYGRGLIASPEEKKRYTIGVPVVNAYATIPTNRIPRLAPIDSLFFKDACSVDTQVLVGDQIRLVKRYKDKQGVLWAGVELLDQAVYRDGVWAPKVCFIEEKFLSAGVKDWWPNAHVINMLASVYAKPSLKSLQLGMVSMGTPVRVINTRFYGWIKIILASGVCGYVLARDLTTQMHAESSSISTRRESVVAAAKKFIKTPYRWGGCSGFDEYSYNLTGVDCSGLVYLSFRASSVNVPRDAHDQFTAAFPLKLGKDLRKGDLIFLAKPSADKKTIRVDHVLMVIGPNQLIESTGLGCLSAKDFCALPEHVRKKSGVRIISPKDLARLGKPLSDLWHGQIGPEGDFIFLGTFLGDEKTLQKMQKRLFV